MGLHRAEMATYKELDPTIRLVILKALCEIRADVLFSSSSVYIFYYSSLMILFFSYIGIFLLFGLAD